MLPTAQPLLSPEILAFALALAGLLHVETAAFLFGILFFMGDAPLWAVAFVALGAALSAPWRRRWGFWSGSWAGTAVEFPFAPLDAALRRSRWRDAPAPRLMADVFLRSLLWSALLAAAAWIVLWRTTDGPDAMRGRIWGLFLLAPVAAVTLRALVGRAFRRHSET